MSRLTVLTASLLACVALFSLKAKNAISLLGKDMDKVAFVAVTTDPKRDIPKVNLAYSRAFGLENAWSFVTGSFDSVKAVWADYGIGVETDTGSPRGASTKDDAKTPDATSETDSVTRGLSDADLALAGKIIDRFGGGYDVSHSVPFWIIDTTGMVRASLDEAATPSDIVTDVRLLMKGR